MSSGQVVILWGFVSNDPKVQVFPDGGKMVRFTLPTTKKWRDRNTKQVKEKTEWHSCIVRGRDADFAAQYIAKRKYILIHGEMESYETPDKDGKNVRHHQIVVLKIDFLANPKVEHGGAPASQEGFPAPGTPQEQANPFEEPENPFGNPSNGASNGPSPDDDIPF